MVIEPLHERRLHATCGVERSLRPTLQNDSGRTSGVAVSKYADSDPDVVAGLL